MRSNAALENNLDIAVQRIGQQTYDVDDRQHPIGLQPDAVVARQHRKLEERVDEHDFGRPDRRRRINNSTFVFNGGLAQDVPWGGGDFAALDNRRLRRRT